MFPDASFEGLSPLFLLSHSGLFIFFSIWAVVVKTISCLLGAACFAAAVRGCIHADYRSVLMHVSTSAWGAKQIHNIVATSDPTL